MDVDNDTAEAQTVAENLDDMDIESTATNDTASTITNRNANTTAYKGPVEEPDKTAAIEDRNLNPVQGSHETSTTANYVHNYAMGVTKELCKVFNSADQGKESANGLDETSHTVDLQTNPIGSLHGHEVETQPSVDIGTQSANELNETSDTNDLETNPVGSHHGHEGEIQPFDLLGCPDNVIQQVLQNFLVKDKPIKPYWNLGALEVREQDANKANFTTDLIAFGAIAFASHSRLLDAATTVFYGENTFDLQHPKVALWWLKRIGPNISKIKHLKVKVEEGDINGLTRPETLWYSIFLLLQAKHQTHRLLDLEVDFANWTHPDAFISPGLHIDARESRNAIITILLSFRGLRKAKIVPGLYVSPWTAGVIQGALLMNPGQTNADVMALEQVFQGPQRARYSF